MIEVWLEGLDPSFRVPTYPEGKKGKKARQRYHRFYIQADPEAREYQNKAFGNLERSV